MIATQQLQDANHVLYHRKKNHPTNRLPCYKSGRPAVAFGGFGLWSLWVLYVWLLLIIFSQTISFYQRPELSELSPNIMIPLFAENGTMQVFRLGAA